MNKSSKVYAITIKSSCLCKFEKHVIQINFTATLSLLFFQTPQSGRRRAEGYGTLPKDLMVSPVQQHPLTHNLPPVHPHGVTGARVRSPPSRSSSFRTPGSSPRASFVRRKPGRFSSFSKSLLRLKPSRWTSSEPNLGDFAWIQHLLAHSLVFLA